MLTNRWQIRLALLLGRGKKHVIIRVKKKLCCILSHFNKAKRLIEHVWKSVQNQVKSKASLDRNNNSEIDNNIIYTHIPLYNKQTIKILRVFHPHAPVRFPSPFSVQFIILRNFVLRSNSLRSNERKLFSS